MAFAQFTSDAVVLADVAACIKQWDATANPAVVAPSASFWTQIVALQHLRAANEIYSRLMARGYDAVLQIPLWDRGVEWERGLSLLYSLEAGGMLEAVDAKLLQALRDAYHTDPDPNKPTGLATVPVTFSGALQSPGDAPGTVGVGSGVCGDTTSYAALAANNPLGAPQGNAPPVPQPNDGCLPGPGGDSYGIDW